jgi:hypothetical protein
VIRRVVIALAILGVLALAALELATERRVARVGDHGAFTETGERDSRLPAASEWESHGAVRPVLTH